MYKEEKIAALVLFIICIIAAFITFVPSWDVLQLDICVDRCNEQYEAGTREHKYCAQWCVEVYERGK